MNPPLASQTFAPPRVVPNFRHAFGGVWRLTVRRFFQPLRWLAVLAAIAVLLLLMLGGLPPAGDARQTTHYLDGLTSVYVTFLVPIFAFISAAGLMRDDLKAGSVDYIFTRPLPRPLFVIFRYLAHTACVQIDLLLAFAALAIAGQVIGIPGITPLLAPLLLSQVLLAMAFSAFGFLCGALTARYIVVGLVYAFVVEVGLGRIPTQINRLSMTQQVLATLRPALARAGVAAGDVPPLNGDASFLATTALLLAFTVITLGAAAVLLGWREPAGAASREV